jgi:hypothetical protein
VYLRPRSQSPQVGVQRTDANLGHQQKVWQEVRGENALHRLARWKLWWGPLRLRSGQAFDSVRLAPHFAQDENAKWYVKFEIELWRCHILEHEERAGTPASPFVADQFLGGGVHLPGVLHCLGELFGWEGV